MLSASSASSAATGEAFTGEAPSASASRGGLGRREGMLRGRAFYESIGSPKMVLAPMVDQSEFAWRMLSRSFLKPNERGNLLAYTPMFHARLFGETQQFRDRHFQPSKAGLRNSLSLADVSSSSQKHDYLDGRPDIDRPLTVQFCANDPKELLTAAQYVQPYCDAVDLNLGCPQGIARKGHYGAFLQEDWNLVASLISTLNEKLEVPVTAKIRILETKEKTLEYARRIVDAGASILTVHGRLREQKGHMTGLADWSVIRYLRDNLPRELVMFANGNILRHEDIQRCLDATGVDGVMTAEGNLSDPTIFAAAPSVGDEGREYWRGSNGKDGYRVDAVFRRYMDIIYEFVLEKTPPERKPLFLPSDPPEPETATDQVLPTEEPHGEQEGTLKRPLEDGNGNGNARPKKRQKSGVKRSENPNLSAMQPHLFSLLRPLISTHTNVRDALARARRGDIDAYEIVLSLTEKAVKQGLLEYEQDPSKFEESPASLPARQETQATEQSHTDITSHDSSAAAVKACKRPYWVCQPYVRPLPKEAVEKGALSLSSKDLKKLQQAEASRSASTLMSEESEGSGKLASDREKADAAAGLKSEEVAREAMVAG